MGVIFDIQRSCTDDGPGIRTTVFFKGCPLRCIWCHNPESQIAHQQIYADTGETIGYEATAEEVMETVMLDKAYYRATGGGMTISGGEPLMQAQFAKELLYLAKKHSIHTCVETCGYTNWNALADILPITDLFLYDVKSTPAIHRRLTGVEQKLILSNLEQLHENGADILLRCPIIPGQNDNDEHFTFLRSLLQKYPRLIGLQIMPYHNLGVGKARRLEMPDPFDLPNPSQEQIAIWRKALHCDESNFCPGNRSLS